MFYVWIIIGIAIGFFVILGTGKIALELYARKKLGQNLTYFTVYVTLLIWYVYVWVLLSIIAFNINQILGWVIAIGWGIGTLVEGVSKLGKDARNSVYLAKQRQE